MPVELDKKLVFDHYNRKEILSIMVDASKHKEVVGSFGGTGYAKRPDVIEYPSDILEQVKRGITSFHASEELWSNPLHIGTQLSKKELQSLRTGWDLLLDIDCKEWRYSQIASAILYDAICFFGIQNVGCKFSGNHGFHFIIPYESFPSAINAKPTAELFPEIPKAIALFLTDKCNKKVSEALLAIDTIEQIAIKSQKKVEEITHPQFGVNGFAVVGIDTVLLTSRHLYRQVYSINEKSGLISLPINPAKILHFQRDLAKIENKIISKYTFLDRNKSTKNEAEMLVTLALDAQTRIKDEQDKQKFAQESTKTYTVEFTEKIPEQFFPPIIQKLFGPLQDGKKRALFILLCFLRCANYTDQEITQKIIEWNKQHPEPLRDTIVQGQLRAFFANPQKIPPPNYQNGAYVDILGPINEKERNPLSQAKKAMERFLYFEQKKKKSRDTQPHDQPKKSRSKKEQSDTNQSQNSQPAKE
jgi:hypothetical protein